MSGSWLVKAIACPLDSPTNALVREPDTRIEHWKRPLRPETTSSLGSCQRSLPVHVLFSKRPLASLPTPRQTRKGREALRGPRLNFSSLVCSRVGEEGFKKICGCPRTAACTCRVDKREIVRVGKQEELRVDKRKISQVDKRERFAG